MIRVHVFVEGLTEETFVRALLHKNLILQGVDLNPILVRTSRTGKGGVVSYAKIKPQLNRKCLEDQTAYVTTMFDLFRLPGDFPGQNSMPSALDPLQKATYLEQQLDADITHRNLIPNFIVYEFEGLLYSDPQAFSGWFGNAVTTQISNERQQFTSPEHVNDGPTTAPSKRILQHCPGYEKPLHGSLIALDIGLDTIRRECNHFDTWVNRLLQLQTGSQT